MSFPDLLSRIEKLPPPIPGEVRPLPPELVGFFVFVTRRFRRWKQSALADMAGVSLSTIERIERGEAVDPASLEKIEKAFNLDPGYLSRPRAPQTADQLNAYLEKQSTIVYIEVHPLKTQPQIRELAECCGFLPLSNVRNPECQPHIQNLVEWFDLASFIRSEHGLAHRREKSRLRELYQCILAAVKSLERQGYNVLAGHLEAPVEGMPDWNYAVLWITNKKSDPGGSKRQYIPFDTMLLPKRITLADCARGFDDE